MENIEKAERELNDYIKEVGEGRENFSFKEFKGIVDKNGCVMEAERMQRGFNGEGAA